MPLPGRGSFQEALHATRRVEQLACKVLDMNMMVLTMCDDDIDIFFYPFDISNTFKNLSPFRTVAFTAVP